MLMVQSKNMTELVKDAPTMPWAGGILVCEPREDHRKVFVFFLILSLCSNYAAESFAFKCDSYIRPVLDFRFLEFDVGTVLPCHEIKGVVVRAAHFAGGGTCTPRTVSSALLVFPFGVIPGAFLDGGTDRLLLRFRAVVKVEFQYLTKKTDKGQPVKTTCASLRSLGDR